MTNAPYGAVERHELVNLAASLPEHAQVFTSAIADALRGSLPDMSDTDIGRVLVSLREAKFFPVFEGMDGGAVRTALVAAGLELTRPAWSEDTP